MSDHQPTTGIPTCDLPLKVKWTIFVLSQIAFVALAFAVDRLTH